MADRWTVVVSKSPREVLSRERALVDTVAAGGVVECSQLTIEQLAATENPRYTIRAELIRELVLGRTGTHLDPLGVRVQGARIIGTLNLTHVPAAVGIELRGCFFERGVLLTGARLPWLTLTASHLPGLDGDGLRVDGDVLLGEGFTVTGQGEEGAVRLLGARSSGQLNLNGARLTNAAGPAFIGDGLHVDGDMFGGGLAATGQGELSAVRLPGAHITGQLNLNRAELANQAGPALIGDGLHVNGGLVLAEGFTATGHCPRGAVRLPGAQISGQLNLDGAALINNAGPALIGDHLQVNGGVFLDGFTATGQGEDGAVRLPGAHVTGQLNLDRAELTNYAGPALIADSLQVDSDMFAEGLTATGHSTDGAVRLPSASISGQLNLNGATLTNPAGPVLDLEDAQAKHLFLPAHVFCAPGEASRSSCVPPARRLALSGLVYSSLQVVDWREWLHLITHHTHDYRPQPYQQLAAVLRAAGRHSSAREVLIAGQRDLRDRGELGGRLIKGAHVLWGAVAGYGYRSGRIALGFLLVLLLAAGLGAAAGRTPTGPGRYVTAHTSQALDPHSPCSLVEQVGVGIDRGLPLASTGISNRCDFDTSTRLGEAFAAFTSILQALVWALAALAVASYLRLRKAS